MITVFVNRKGDTLFTYPDVDVRTGDRVLKDGKIYLVVSRTFDVRGFYVILLHESDETE